MQNKVIKNLKDNKVRMYELADGGGLTGDNGLNSVSSTNLVREKQHINNLRSY